MSAEQSLRTLPRFPCEGARYGSSCLFFFVYNLSSSSPVHPAAKAVRLRTDMASHNAHGGNIHPIDSSFERELDKIWEAYTGDEEAADELVNSFLDIACEIARDAGLGEGANRSGGSGQWQPNKNVSKGHLQAALTSLASVREVLAALNRETDTGRLEEYLVSSIHFCPTTFSLTLCCHPGLISGIM